MPILILFVVMPIVEIALLIQVGSWIGVLPTIAIVILTAVCGTWLLRRQGLNTLMQAQQKMANGQLPAEEMATGIALAVGGALLLTPGFVTDAIGFMCLIPQARGWLIQRLARSAHFASYQQTHVYSERDGNGHSRSQSSVIEGEFKREDS